MPGAARSLSLNCEVRLASSATTKIVSARANTQASACDQPKPATTTSTAEVMEVQSNFLVHSNFH